MKKEILLFLYIALLPLAFTQRFSVRRNLILTINKHNISNIRICINKRKNKTLKIVKDRFLKLSIDILNETSNKLKCKVRLTFDRVNKFPYEIELKKQEQFILTKKSQKFQFLFTSATLGIYSCNLYITTYVSKNIIRTHKIDQVLTLEVIDLPGHRKVNGTIDLSNKIKFNKIDWKWQAGLHSKNVFMNNNELVLRVEDSTGIGAQLNSKSTYRYGMYKVLMKASPETEKAGVCSSFFYYWGESDTIYQEIDIEILSRERNLVHFTVHCNQKKKSFKCYVEKPGTQYHLYAFEWTPHQITFYIDGKIAIDIDKKKAIVKDKDYIPTKPGNIILNNWSGNPYWTGNIPNNTGDLYMRVKNIYFSDEKKKK